MMIKSNKLKELFEKYRNGSISESEIHKLASILNKNSFDPELEKYYKSLWDHASTENNSPDSEKVWNNIKSKIIKDTFTYRSHRKTNQKLFIRFLSYAAVALIAIIAARYYSGYINPNKSLAITPEIKEYSVPYGSKSKLVLSDGTHIWLNSGSKLRFNNDFNVRTRTVFLEGEAFFDVATNKEKPFYVKTNEINIRVYGTSFNVKAFKEEETIETTLISGSVMIEKTDEFGNIIKNVQMEPNQIASYSHKRGEIVLSGIGQKYHDNQEQQTVHIEKGPGLQTFSPEVKMAIAWKDNLLSFKGETMANLILKLQRWYNVEITLKNDGLGHCRFTGAFDNETIEQALEALKLTAPFSYTIKENKIVIY